MTLPNLVVSPLSSGNGSNDDDSGWIAGPTIGDNIVMPQDRVYFVGQVAKSYLLVDWRE
jgi:hypothetical protein